MGQITNAKTIISNGPTANTQANAIAPAGPIVDYAGLSQLLLLHLQEAKVIAGQLIAVTDAGDGSLTQLNTINADLT